jgi:hypothetical protein
MAITTTKNLESGTLYKHESFIVEDKCLIVINIVNYKLESLFSNPLKTYEFDGTEEEYHMLIRNLSIEKGLFVPELSTDPEYTPKKEEK